MIKIITIVGARPQFIKASILSKSFQQSAEFEEILIHTGQHFDFQMDKIFFDELNIQKPKYHLNINSLSHGAMTGRMLTEIEEILIEEKPDYVLVYGDTNSTLAGALAAKKLHIKVIHVEAGLRSFNMNMPEEINRILTDRISDLLFCPTEKAVDNLKSEGFEKFDSELVNSGDVMYDLALFFQKNSGNYFNLNKKLRDNYILCTVHREENTNDIVTFKGIIDGLNQIAKEHKIIFPVHPRTKKIIEKNKLKLSFDTIDPVGYLDMISLLRNSSLVITDSGGLQKEAFFYKKLCITLRNETEWTELVDNGYNRLVGNNSLQIYDAYKELINETKTFSDTFYGSGDACNKILSSIFSYHSQINR